MGKILATISDPLEKEVRNYIRRYLRRKRGGLSLVVELALRDWLNARKQEGQRLVRVD